MRPEFHFFWRLLILLCFVAGCTEDPSYRSISSKRVKHKQSEPMEGNWDFYEARVDHKPASIFVNFSYRNRAPIAGVEQLVWLAVYFQDPRDDGFYGKGEGEDLLAIEDKFSADLKASEIEHHYVGRNTSDGVRDFYIYCRNSDAVKSVLTKSMSAFPQYEFDTDSRLEADWSAYLEFLYPSPRDMQLIGNRHVLEKLEKSQDCLETPRVVQHWAYFPDEKSRSQFVGKSQELGFKFDYHIEPDEDDGQMGCVISRTHACDESTVRTVTLDLFDLAIEFNGRYDGWETPVVKADNE